jgi:alpha-aminoadipic semialdehyde synthase
LEYESSAHQSQGGLEFVSRAATIDDPFFVARPADHPNELAGIQVMSVDILPSEIPLDSSKHFSNKLYPYLRSLIRSEQGRSLEQADTSNLGVLERGTIISGGVLREPHAWLSTHLSEEASNSVSKPSAQQSSDPLENAFLQRKKVLLLGSGMVAKPAVDHISSRKDLEVIVGTPLKSINSPSLISEILASNNLSEAKALTSSMENATALRLDIQDQTSLETAIKGADIVIRQVSAFC